MGAFRSKSKTKLKGTTDLSFGWKEDKKNNRQEAQFDLFLIKDMHGIWWKVGGAYEDGFCQRADKTKKDFLSSKARQLGKRAGVVKRKFGHQN